MLTARTTALIRARNGANSKFRRAHSFKWFSTTASQIFQSFPFRLGLDGVLSLADGQPYSLTLPIEKRLQWVCAVFWRPDRVGDPFAGTSTPLPVFLNADAHSRRLARQTGTGGLRGRVLNTSATCGRNAFVGRENYRNFILAVFKGHSDLREG